MLKVLVINATFGDGSTGTIVKDIQTECLNQGIDCHVAYSLSSIPKDKIYGIKVGNWFSNKLHAALSRINGKQAYFSYFSTFNLIKKIDKLKPDIINIHNLHNNYINLNLLLKAIAKRNISLVVTLHDCWFFTGGCSHFTQYKCSEWMVSCSNCPISKGELHAYLGKRTSTILKDRQKYFSKIKNLYIVGVSDWITNIAKESVLRDAKFLTIHNGLDTNIFKPTPTKLKSQLGLEGEKILLGPASKWLLDINRELLTRVSESLEDNQILLLFGYNEKYHGEIKLPKIVLYGYTNNKEELAQLYSIADVFVNCSREDTLSTINIEAQSCGVPLITYNNTGNNETAHPTISRCITTGIIDNFITCINEIIQRTYNYHIDELHSWINKKFNKNENYKKYIRLFKSITT